MEQEKTLKQKAASKKKLAKAVAKIESVGAQARLEACQDKSVKVVKDLLAKCKEELEEVEDEARKIGVQLTVEKRTFLYKGARRQEPVYSSVNKDSVLE